MKQLSKVGFKVDAVCGVFEEISEAVGWYHVHKSAQAEFPRPADERSDLEKLLKAARNSPDEIGTRFDRLANITKARFFRLSRWRPPSLSELDQIQLNTLTPDPCALVAAVLKSLPRKLGRSHEHACNQLLLDISTTWRTHFPDDPGIHRNGSRTHHDQEYSGLLLDLSMGILRTEDIRVGRRTVGQRLFTVRDRAVEKATARRLEPASDQSQEDESSLDEILKGS